MARKIAPNPSSQRVTLHDIATEAGCSHTAVSLALRGSSEISEERRAAILDVARKLQYRPNLAARQLRYGRSNTIGIFARRLNDAVQIDLVSQLMDQLYGQSHRPVLGLGALSKGPWFKSPWITTFHEIGVDAIIVLCEGPLDAQLPDWADRLPVILVGTHLKPDLQCDTVYLDFSDAGRLAAEHLLERGREDVAIVCPEAHPLRKSCEQTMRAAGGRSRHIDRVTHVSDLQQMGIDIARTMLDEGDLPSAVIHLNSLIASHFMIELLDAGVRIPEDIAVVSYDRIASPRLMRLAPTTVEQPIEAMAPAAIELAVQRLADPKRAPVHRALSHQLVVRQST